MRKSQATIETMAYRKKAETPRSRTSTPSDRDALERELFAWQSILNSVRAMYGAAGVGR